MKPRTLGITAGVIVLVAVGFLLFRLPQPIIELRPETLFSIGGFDVTNTIFTAWVMVALISIGLVLGTRRLTLIPRGFQNLFEAVMEGFGTIAFSVAGEKNGRRFFPVVFILFLYILLCNWTALTPVFNVVGVVENEAEHVRHEAEEKGASPIAESDEIQGWIIRKGGISYVPLFTKTKYLKVEFPAGTSAEDRLVLMEQALAAKVGRQPPTREQIIGEHRTVLDEGQTYGVLAPFFRGVNTDVNATLSYAIWSAIFVEFWGFTALGLLGYGSKFLNFKGGPIGIFVGLLELISEFARLISFTFRLFGNIFAGEVLLFMMSFLVPFVLVDVFYGLEIFVGLIQAFVFAMLTLVFGVMAVASHGGHEEHGHDEKEAHGAAQAAGH